MPYFRSENTNLLEWFSQNEELNLIENNVIRPKNQCSKSDRSVILQGIGKKKISVNG